MKKLLKVDDSVRQDDTSSCELGCEPLPHEETEKNNTLLRQLERLLPCVVDALQNAGRLHEYLAFNRLLAEGRFPLDNIAFLLFLDVVRWYDLEKNTTAMRYNPDVKLFWNTGLKLFKGRFLRFMGGQRINFKGQQMIPAQDDIHQKLQK